jgi:gliding motility-associated-like protein
VILTQPGRLNMTIDASVSADGAYNISCAGESTGSLSVTAFNYVVSADYRWNDGGMGANRSGLPAGEYKVIITDANNCQIDSIVTLTQPDPIKVTIDEIIKSSCPDIQDGAIKITASGGVPLPDYTYLWSDQSTTKDLTNIPSGDYQVTVKDFNSCSVTKSVTVSPVRNLCLIINDAFSPNNDGTNDYWNIGNISLYPSIEVTIYNRWGQSVWKSGRGYPSPWDGKSNGADLPIDSYHYVIDLHNGTKPIIGDVTIVR